MENQSARCRQHRAVAGSPADVKPQDLAGCEIDFRKACKFIWIRTRQGYDVQLSSASSESKIAAVVDVRRVERVRDRAVGRGPVAACVPEANDVVIAGF